MNMKEIAQLAGVTAATVSNAINGTGNVSEKKRKEILLSRTNLKPSYLVCSYDLEELKESGKFSEDEINKIIETEINEAKKLGIDIIEIDNQKIRENMQHEKMLKSESEVPSR